MCPPDRRRKWDVHLDVDGAITTVTEMVAGTDGVESKSFPADPWLAKTGELRAGTRFIDYSSSEPGAVSAA